MTDPILNQLEQRLDDIAWRHKLAETLRGLGPTVRTADEISTALLPVLRAYGDQRAAQALADAAAAVARHHGTASLVAKGLRAKAAALTALEPFNDYREQAAAMPHPDETVHLCPADDEATTGCCRRSPFDLDPKSRMTLNPASVTCQRPPAPDEGQC